MELDPRGRGQREGGPSRLNGATSAASSSENSACPARKRARASAARCVSASGAPARRSRASAKEITTALRAAVVVGSGFERFWFITHP